MPLSPKEILATARVMVRRRAPYLTSAVLALIPREMPGLGTMAVSEHMVLYWDPKWVGQLSPEEVMWDLLHEVSHVLRSHSERARKMSVTTPQLRALWNHAGDAEINDDLVKMGCKHRVLYIVPKTLGCEDGGLAETYYHHLRQKQHEQGGGGAGDKQGDDKPECGHGWCGSGAGRPIPDEPEEKGKGKDSGRSQADVQRVRQQVAEEVRKAVQQRGSVPAGWQIWADGLLKPAKVPWQKLLAHAIRSSIADRMGCVNYTYSRPARRQAMFGHGKGKPILPTLRAPTPRVGVGLDTSGSMGRDEIETAASEITGILRAVRAEVDFLSCDCQVHKVMKLKHPRQFAEAFKGGGGTSFVPVFEGLAQLRRRPEVFIFITDGMGPAPDLQPACVKKVIWVLVGPYKTRPTGETTGNPIQWGHFIEVDRDDADKAARR